MSRLWNITWNFQQGTVNHPLDASPCTSALRSISPYLMPRESSFVPAFCLQSPKHDTDPSFQSSFQTREQSSAGCEPPPMAPQPSRPRGPFSGRAGEQTAATAASPAPAAPHSPPVGGRRVPAPLRSAPCSGRCPPVPALRKRPCPASHPATGAARRLRPTRPRPLRRRGQGSTNAKEQTPEGSATRPRRCRARGIRGCPGTVGHCWGSALSFPKSRWPGQREKRLVREQGTVRIPCIAQLPWDCFPPRVLVREHHPTQALAAKAGVCSSLTNCFRNTHINCSISSARCSGSCTR